MGIPANHSNLKLKNVYAFIQSKWIKLYKYLFTLSDHRLEQEIYREHIAKTNEWKCWEKGECPCECAIKDVILSDPGCHKNCFGPMLSKGEWTIFKAENMFSVDTKRKQIINYKN